MASAQRNYGRKYVFGFDFDLRIIKRFPEDFMFQLSKAELYITH